MARNNKYKKVYSLFSNFFQTIGYVFCTFLWLWVVVIALPSVIESGALKSFMNHTDTEQVVVRAEPTNSPVVLAAASAVTIVIVLISVIALYRLPKSINKGGAAMVKPTIDVLVPIVTHHRPIPEKERLLLSARLQLALQYIAALLPLLIVAVLPPVDGLPGGVRIVVATALALVSLCAFTIAFFLRPKTTSRTQSHAFRG